MTSVPPLRVLVTGGTRGIGRAIALRFAREGARVAVTARSSPDLDRVVREIDAAGGKGDAGQGNMAEKGSVEAAVYRAVDFCGGVLDVVVNNAGSFDLRDFEETDMDTWERLVGVNMTGAYLTALEAMPALMASKRGHLFNISSALAREPRPGTVIYCATKAGLAGLSAGLRAEYGPKGLRVTTVFPRATNTDMLAPHKKHWAGVAFNTPEDVAEVVWQAWRAEAAPAEVFVAPPA